MNEGYGNVGWQIFVYISYIVVAGSLLLYVGFSLFSRKKSLKSMQDEGFFELEQNKNTSGDLKK